MMILVLFRRRRSKVTCYLALGFRREIDSHFLSAQVVKVVECIIRKMSLSVTARELDCAITNGVRRCDSALSKGYVPSADDNWHMILILNKNRVSAGMIFISLRSALYLHIGTTRSQGREAIICKSFLLYANMFLLQPNQAMQSVGGHCFCE